MYCVCMYVHIHVLIYLVAYSFLYVFMYDMCTYMHICIICISCIPKGFEGV